MDSEIPGITSNIRSTSNGQDVIPTYEDSGAVDAEVLFPMSGRYQMVLLIICALLLGVLVMALCALRFSSKLPEPFKVLAWVLLGLDIAVVTGSGLEPWLLASENAYFRDVGGLGLLLVNTVTLLIAFERLIALKLPLKYIACSNKGNVTAAATLGILITEVMIYVMFRFVGCLKTGNYDACFINKTLLVLGAQIAICSSATACFVQVVYELINNKCKHIRRITRMGLPQTYANDVMDTRVSATLFLFYPMLLMGALFSVLSTHWGLFSDGKFLATCALCSRLLVVAVHGAVFAFWFEESRLYLLSIVAPCSPALRSRADEMRIEVYNIVVSQAHEGRARQSRSSELSRTSRGSKRLSSLALSSRAISTTIVGYGRQPSAHPIRE